MTEFAGREVLVAGAGVTGQSVCRALLAAGARVTVTDARAEQLKQLEQLTGARCVVGLDVHPPGTDLLVTSPGWPPSASLLRSAQERGITVIGEVELAWLLAQDQPEPPHWLAVTGTNGKTTTVTMLAEILRAAGLNGIACGNVGYTAVDAVTEGYTVLAVELSSFQLHWSHSVSPYASAVLNVAEDHLDWHGSFTSYAEAKGKIHTHTGMAAYNADDPVSRRLALEHAPDEAPKVGFSTQRPGPGRLGVRSGLLVDRAFGTGGQAADTELCEVTDVAAPGQHNLMNALAAAALARSYGLAPEAIGAGLRSYAPGDHRARQVADVAGVRYVNDSKATNPHAASGSLMAYEHVVWIAGGQLKGAGDTVDALVAANADRLRGVVLMGADADLIAEALARHAPDVPVNRPRSGDDTDMGAVVRAAQEMARPGDVVLLAPAAASLDMFRSYAHRGEAFAEAVGVLGGTRRGG